MANAAARWTQSVIDRLRGKERPYDPADAFGLRPREAIRKASQATEMERVFYGHAGRIAHKWNHYLEIYDFFFAPYRNTDVRILEIGVSRGGSLEIWRKFFGPQARIAGIDIDPACAERVDPENLLVIGDQSDPAVLAAALDRLGGGVDIVIDDGSHVGRHQIASFEYLYPRIAESGLYVCEDLHCSFWETHEGGLGRSGTMIEHGKQLIDRLHAWYLDDAHKAEFMPFATSTYALHFYLDLLIIEKRPVGRPFHVQFPGSKG